MNYGELTDNPDSPVCAECGRPALDPLTDTLGEQPICGECLADYLADMN